MTVAEFIELLKQQPQDARVTAWNAWGDFESGAIVLQYSSKTHTVLIETEESA